MNEYLVTQLKEGRRRKNLKQSDVAKMIGVKGNTLSNYECGVSEPDIDTFCALCDIYGLDPSEILGEAYGLNVQGTDFDIKPSEIEMIKKYRKVNPRVKEMIDMILEKEYQYWENEQNNSNIIPMAAHNDFAYEKGQQELMQQDLDEL